MSSLISSLDHDEVALRMGLSGCWVTGIAFRPVRKAIILLGDASPANGEIMMSCVWRPSPAPFLCCPSSGAESCNPLDGDVERRLMSWEAVGGERVSESCLVRRVAYASLFFLSRNE